MVMTLQEIMDTCPNWERFCDLHGYSVWAVNEGGGDVSIAMTIHQAHHLGILKVTDWKAKDFEEVYPTESSSQTP